MTNDETTRFLAEYLKRWNQHDVEGILSMMTEDCEFDTSAGPDVCGRRWHGLDEARTGIERVIKAAPDFSFSDVSTFVCGDHAVAEWTMSHTAANGERVSARGCDLFVLRDGKIHRKDSYRKARIGAEYLPIDD